VEDAAADADLADLFPLATSASITDDVWLVSKRATLSVSETWKGSAAAIEFLAYTESSPACGFQLSPGQTFVLFARRSTDGTLIASRHGVSGIGVHSVDGDFLARYRSQTRALRRKALEGAAADESAFALHLTRWHDPEALAVYRRLAQSDERDPDAYLGLGIALTRYGHRFKGLEAFRKAASLDPDLAMIGNGIETSQPIRLTALHARALFILTGFMDENSDDWSNLAARSNCATAGTTLTATDFSASDLTRCSFRRARLIRSSFATADLSSVSFESAVLRDVSFSGADLADSSFASATFKDAIWDGADLRNADFSDTRDAGPFRHTAIDGANFSNAINPGPFLALANGKPMSLVGVSFRNASLAVSAFLTADGYSPEAELQADISQADFTGATIDCGARDRLHLAQGINAAPETFLLRFQNEQRVARYIRDNWKIAGLTERCQRYVELTLEHPMATSATP
ncbi:MAG TPA: pentapeptide repeat-containing protein, partial [Dongiaceae bacterium]|nr:pentapeptide repeat-containing protein [Dongiaceae bacterium]